MTAIHRRRGRAGSLRWSSKGIAAVSGLRSNTSLGAAAGAMYFRTLVTGRAVDLEWIRRVVAAVLGRV